MTDRTRILLKTTIGPVTEDWNVGRFSSLAEVLASLTAPAGEPIYAVTAHDRIETAAGDDADLGEPSAGGLRPAVVVRCRYGQGVDCW